MANQYEKLVAKKRPVLALVVDVEEVFFHCSKAFLRSELWSPATWDADGLPSATELAKALMRPDAALDELESYYGASYAARLY